MLFQIIDDQFRSIRFVSQALTTTEANWQVQKLEIYTIIYNVRKLDHFLRGSQFIVHTDNRNLVFIKSSNSAKIVRWRLLLQEYDFELSLVAGKDNIIGDTLSRAYPDDLSAFKFEPLSDNNNNNNDNIGFTDYWSHNSKFVL